MISVSINLSKIDKSELYEGKNGKYLNLLIKETPNDKYGNDYMVTQSVSKESRENGKNGEIVGNGKNIGTNNSQSSNKGGGAKASTPVANDYDAGLPF